MRRVVCPGSFDPVTMGHMDVIGRASELFDEVVVAVLVNQSKSSLFTVEERMEMLRQVTSVYDNVVVDSWSGLLAEYCKERQIPAIIKGLRAISDFDSELQMAQMNRQLSGVETLFLATKPHFSFLSSSLIKEIAKYGGDVSTHVPPNVLSQLIERLGARK
jgi:pantetheine-phosphate adenylyltransferase